MKKNPALIKTAGKSSATLGCVSVAKTKKRLNPRKIWTPKSPLAKLGFYANPVQKVVRRWRAKIGEEIFDANIHGLMITCFCSVQLHDETAKFFYHKRFALEVARAVEKVRGEWRGKIDDKKLGMMLDSYATPLLSSITKFDSGLDPDFQNYKLFILELLLAVDEVANDSNSLPHWILKWGFSGDGSDYENGVPMLRPWTKISKMIKAATATKSQPNGMIIEPDAIRAEAKRMKLTV